MACGVFFASSLFHVAAFFFWLLALKTTMEVQAGMVVLLEAGKVRQGKADFSILLQWGIRVG